MRFKVLNPKRAKRDTIAANLDGLGTVTWQRSPALGWGRSTTSKDAAYQAALMSQDRGWSGLRQTANTRLLAAQYEGTRAAFDKDPAQVAVCWNGLNGTRQVFMQAAKDAGARRLFFELAPFPGRITADPMGVNYVNSLPRDVQPYHDWAHDARDSTRSWRALRRDISQRPGAQHQNAGDLPPLTDPFVFVALQVPGDSQLRLFGGAFRTVETFVTACLDAAAHLPEGWHMRIKDHPSAPASVAPMIAEARHGRAVLDNGTDTFEQVAAARAVVTVNSSVGLEAAMFDKPVVTCGQVFWALPGVADHAPDSHALAQACAAAQELSFDGPTRDVVLDYLDQVYYPPRSGAPDMIAARLKGADAYGFWNVERVTP